MRRADVRLEQASEEIADLQFFNQYVIDNLVSGLATADEQNRLLTFNRSAVLITGHAAADVLGKSAGEVLQLPDGVRATTRRGPAAHAQQAHRRAVPPPDGRVIDLGLSVAQLPLPDGRRGYLYTFQDVTDVQRLERDAQLQKRLAAVGEMAAGIAHEIRNPLASMSGSMQILRQELPLSSDQAQLMDIVLRESERLNDTIRSFLAYARPQRVDGAARSTCAASSGHGDAAAQQPRRSASGTRSTSRCRATRCSSRRTRIRCVRLSGTSPPTACARCPTAATLTLSARVTRRRHAGGVLTVTDEGVGIPADEIDGIFQPFRGSFGKGTGLGLAIVHRIVSDYNATIDVQSQPGRGTTFRVDFPAGRRRRVPAGAWRRSSTRRPRRS